MRKHMYYDPFVEHDELQKQFQQMIEDKVRYRATKQKFEIVAPGYSDEGDSSLEFRVKKSGEIEVRVSTYQDTKKITTHRCDLGHQHPVISRETFYFDIVYMSQDEALALRDFLNERLP